MDGLQVDDTSREKTYASTDSHKMILPQSYASESSPSQYPPYPQHMQTSPLYEEGKPIQQRPRMPWGLSLRGYTFLIIGITAVVMAAALGGGLGGAIAAVANDNSSPTATVTATVTASTASSTASPTAVVRNYTPILPSQVNTTALDCRDQATISSQNGDTYTMNCNTNYPGNDIVSFISYTLDTCINACSNMNTRSGEMTCHGVLFNSNMQTIFEENAGNCWLKSLMTGATPEGLPPSVGAVLVTS
ncbi:hypothetical protein PV08_03887 [Exophiala spinifera]|uniref:Apple domain-containing protein n=1 Tax=Exophiala spinifera TaxID=91928 RepID=A0A0D2BZF1_9EURO|nr:uncharacterized protein PV08_03887 [Exophiala spinifera]KIW16699.1 hypothetical protein PV08_03887 [Exophiala spinifera]